MPKKKKTTAVKKQEAEQIDEFYKNLPGKSKKAKKSPVGKIIITLAVILVICAGVIAGLMFMNDSGPLFVTGSSVLESGVWGTIGGYSVSAAKAWMPSTP